MKMKFLLVSVLVCAAVVSRANIWKVEVSNFQFNPANLTISVGDTVKWVYVNGFHTTTSTGVPAGAATWDAPMQHSTDSFEYVVKVAGNYSYFCSVHPTAMLGTLTVSGALPVVLNAFTVSPGKTSGSTLVNWSTATETNTKWFVVTKSVNGSSYTEVTKVKAAGNASVMHSYSVTDNNVGSTFKYIYYRLQVVDNDGTITYSPVKVFVNNVIKKLVLQISPNPLTAPGHLMFQFNADKEGEMQVQLIDAGGKFIQKDEMHAQQGLNNGHFHIGSVAAGTYNVVFSLDGIKETHKIVIQ